MEQIRRLFRGEKMKLKEIEISKVRFNPWNPNEMVDSQFKHLQEEYKRVGYLQPILVRPKDGNYEVIDGEHRFKAYEDLKLKTIPAIIKEMDDTTAKFTTLNLNKIKGENNPVKYAELLAELKKEVDIETITQVLKMNTNELEQYDILLDLPEDIELPTLPETEYLAVYKLLCDKQQEKDLLEGIKYTDILNNESLAIMEMIEWYVHHMRMKKDLE